MTDIAVLKNGASGMVLALLVAAPAWAGALPSGGHYVAGKGEIGKAGQSLTVNQSSTTGIINWNSFSIGSKGAVNFNNGSGATLNRVTGGDLSKIAGSLHATGSLYLMNSAGVIVSGTGHVVTGGSFVASSSLSDSLQNEKLKRTGGDVTNRGTIVAGDGVTLAGQSVTDRGSISAESVNLHAASELKIGGTISALDADGSGGTVVATAKHIAVGATANISASGTRGGTVLIGGDVHGGAIQGDNFVSQKVSTARTTRIANGAQISANASQSKGGNIVIWSNGHTTFAGAVSAKGQTSGGFTEVSSHDLLGFTGRVDLTSAHGTIGTLLLDPENVVITDGTTTNGSIVSGTFTATGDDSVLNVADLEAALATANLEVTTGGSSTGTQAGDITVLAPITWSSGHTLTLDAYHSVAIDAPIAITGAGGLAIKTNDGGSGGLYSIGDGAFVDYGSTDNGGTLSINGTSYTLLYTMAQVQAINSNLNGNYALATSLNASAVKGWTPLGTSQGSIENSGFSGTFDGLGNIVSGLNISLASDHDVGFFGASSGTIRDIGLVGGSVRGGQFSGDLVGNNPGTIINAFATGTVSSSSSFIGGLAGYNSGTITQAFSTGTITSKGGTVGGLVGANEGAISDAYASGTVSANTSVGGFAGFNNGTIQESYATGMVRGIGASSNVIGGFVGYNAAAGTISESYETGAATGSTEFAGFAGDNEGTAGLSNSPVYFNSDKNPVGGFCLCSNGTQNSGGLTTPQMMMVSSFIGWSDFGSTPGASGQTWVIVDGDGSLNNTGGAAGGTTPMLLSEYSTNIVTAHQLQLMELGLSADYTLANNINLIGTSGNDVWGATGFVPIGGNGAGAFGGEFNGNDHTLSNLTINNTAESEVGLFGDLDGSVDNLKLTRAVISSTESGSEAGILVGYIDDGTVTGVSTAGTVTLNAATGYAGGLAGDSGGVIDTSTSSAAVSNITAGGDLGGLVGYSDAGTIEGSSASGKVIGGGAADAGGLVGDNHGGTIVNSHASGKITATAAAGGSVGGLVGFDEGGASVLVSYATGAVSADDSYVGGLIGAANADTVTNSYATGAVSGKDSNAGGLIGYASGGGSLSGSHATGKVTVTYGFGTANTAGGLVGGDTSYSIDNSYASGAVSADGQTASAGGLVGYVVDAFVTNSHATGAVSVKSENAESSFAGGLIGETVTGAHVDADYATGKVTGDDLADAGGLIGYSLNENSIDDDYATGAVEGNVAGGLIGFSDNGNSITDSYASGAVTGVLNGSTAFTGGLIGESYKDADLVALYATGSVDGGGVTSVAIFAGGLIGYIVGNVPLISSYATGSVKDAYGTGGLVGVSGGSILDSYATGNVTAGTSVGAEGGGVGGGLVALNSGTISNSYASGNVAAILGSNGVAGGFVGENVGAIDHSFATGSVAASSAAGGLAGTNTGVLSYVYAMGSVTGDGKGTSTAYFGGLIGVNDGNVTQAYAVGDVSGTGAGKVGGLVAYNNGGTITAAYWDTQTTGQSTSAGGVGRTTAQLQSGLPAGFSSSDWSIVAGKSFPYLSWQVASGTPEVISGTISGETSDAGLGVHVRVNGTYVTPLDAMSSGANGYYYELLAPGTISSSGSDVLAYLLGGSGHANAVYQNATGSLTGVNLAANTLTVTGSATSQTSLLAAMEKALGASTSYALYTSAGAFTAAIDLNLDLSASSFTIDHAINIGTGTLKFAAAGPISQDSSDAITAATVAGSSVGALALNSATNDITDLGAFTTGGNHDLELTDDHALTVDGALNAGTHNIDLTTVGSSNNLAIDAKLTGGTINLVTTGQATESSAGAIGASLLNVTAATGIALTSSKNKITKLGTDKTTSGSNKVTL